MPDELQRCRRPLTLCLAVIVIDQLSKWLAVTLLPFGEPQPLLGILNLTLIHNPGISFGLFADSGWSRIVFSIIALTVAAWLLLLTRRNDTGRCICIAYSCIAAGALGNAIDRIRLGYVIDFFHLHYGDYHFPIFNVADIAINIGAALLLLSLLLPKRPQRG